VPGFEGLQAWLSEIAWLRLDLLGRLLLASLLGGAIGWEREVSGKPAGLRTNILICVGATLLTELSISFSALGVTDLVRPDPARITAQIVSGIGFLGAGTIIQARGSVTGLTTAATLWVVAAIGIAVGGRAYLEAAGATVLVLLVLVLLGRLEDAVLHRRTGRTFRVRLDGGGEAVDGVARLLEELGLRAHCESAEKDDVGTGITALYEVRGPEPRFREARRRLLERPEVRALTLE